MQNINLLEITNTTKKSFLTAKLFLQIISAWAILLFVTYLIGVINTNMLSKTLAKLEEDKKNLTQQITFYIERAKKFPAGHLAGMTEAEYNAIQNVTRDYNSTGFSNSLTTLADDVPNGIWLENFEISRKENLITFSGQTTSENLLPLFLTKINKDKNYTGTIFNKVNIQKNLADKKIKFTISN